MCEAIIGVCGTLAGTLLGWLLQFIKTRKIFFSKIILHPITKDGFLKAYFQISIYNSSHYARAIRNPKIIGYSNKNEVINESVQESKLFENSFEKDEYEKYRRDLDIINLPAHGSIVQRCMIEDQALDYKITRAILIYEDEKFKIRKIKIQWVNEESKGEK